jgi:excisionase family DNA binding protein
LTDDQVDEYYLTVAEVAEVLRLNQQTVRNWIDQGSLPALRVGRRVRIKRSDLDRLLSEGYSAGPNAGAPDDGPSAEDFWGGEPVGVAEPGADASGSTADPSAGVAETDAASGSAVTNGAAPGTVDPTTDAVDPTTDAVDPTTDAVDPTTRRKLDGLSAHRR